MHLAEMIFVHSPSENNGKQASKPNYLNQCKSRLARYQSDAMRDFADVLHMSFAHETSFNSLEGAEMQFASRKQSVCLYGYPDCRDLAEISA